MPYNNMPYKKKITLLGSIVGVLALVYLLTLFFDPARVNARNERFTWLPSGARDKTDRIEIIAGSETLELVLRSGKWFAVLEGATGSQEVPVKQGRVDDVLRLLSSRGAFPRRGASTSSHETLGLASNAPRIVIHAGAGLPLLDLLVGHGDSSGKEVFLRKNGENEFRSGDRLISSYVNANKATWYDLKLFDDTDMSLVQRVKLNFITYNGGQYDETPLVGYVDYNIVRSGDTWLIEGDNNPLDKENTDSWLQGILEAQGDDFIPLSEEINPGAFSAAATITIELGNGEMLSLQISELAEDNKAVGLVGGKDYMYSLPGWTVSRLLRERGFFK